MPAVTPPPVRRSGLCSVCSWPRLVSRPLIHPGRYCRCPGVKSVYPPPPPRPPRPQPVQTVEREMIDNEDWAEIDWVIKGYERRAADCDEKRLSLPKGEDASHARLKTKADTYRHCAELLRDALNRVLPPEEG